MDGARLAAHHCSKERVMRTKRKVVEAIVSARNRGPRFGCPHVDMQLQKSLGGV